MTPGAAFAAQSLVLEGPAGELEARLDFPDSAQGRDPAAPVAFAVVCHPHPLLRRDADQQGGPHPRARLQ